MVKSNPYTRMMFTLSIRQMALSLCSILMLCVILKPVKISISLMAVTLSEQAKHDACETAYYLG